MNQEEKQVAERTKLMCTRLLARAPQNIEKLLSQENWSSLGTYVHGACKDSLLLAMLDARINKDFTSSKQHLKQACDFSEIILRAPNGMSPCDYDLSIHCSILFGNLPLAKDLAKKALSEQRAQSGNYFDINSEILASFVLGDLAMLIKLKVEFDSLEADYWWSKQNVYHSIFEAVLSDSQRELDHLLSSLEDSFASRASDKKFGDQLPEYGGSVENSLVLDFVGLSSCIIAENKGLLVSVDTKYLPEQMRRV